MSSRNEEKKSFTTAGLAGDLPDVSHLSISAVVKPAKIGMDPNDSPVPWDELLRPLSSPQPSPSPPHLPRDAHRSVPRKFDELLKEEEEEDDDEEKLRFSPGGGVYSQIMFRKPPKPITGPPSTDNPLPGGNIDFNEGWEKFSRHAVFYMNSDREVNYYDPKTKLNKTKDKTLTVMLQQINDHLIRSKAKAINEGAQNRFYKLNLERAREVAKLTGNKLEKGEHPGEMGVRRWEENNRTAILSTHPTKAEIRQLRMLWEEVWMTLHAAACGLHPHVYACGLIPVLVGDKRGLEMIYVVEKHWPLFDYLTARKHDDFDHGEGLKDELRILMDNAAKMGLIHGDLKPGNIVVDISLRTGRLYNLMFIDLDAAWTRFETADKNCIETINSFMLLINGHCGHGADVTAISGLLYGVSQRLQKDLLPLYLNTGEGTEEPAAKRGRRKASIRQLCNVFINESSSWPRFARTPEDPGEEKEEREKEEKERREKKGEGEGAFSMFAEDNMATITETLLGLANHYAVYYRTKTNKPGCSYKPFDEEDKINPDQPAIETLVNIISKRLLDDAFDALPTPKSLLSLLSDPQ